MKDKVSKNNYFHWLMAILYFDRLVKSILEQMTRFLSVARRP